MKKNFDYLILGGGMGGLVIASLLSKDGKSVCLVEANSVVGGHAYTMKKDGFQYCHDVQYLMGCQIGGPMHKYLKQVNLDKKVYFNKMDSKSYDLISIKNKKIDIPLGMDNYLENLINIFPEHKKNLIKYFKIEKKIVKEAKGYEKILTKWDIIKAPWDYLTIIKYMNYTLEDIFNKFKFSDELKAILAGRMGNLSASPNEVSFLMYAAMDVAYSDSAYFPKKGMGYFINEIKEKIEENKNSKVILNTSIKEIIYENKKVIGIKTNDENKIFTKNIISNIDPIRTFKLIKNYKVPKLYNKKLKYNYSDSIFCIYLGLKGIDLKKEGFKKRNIWHHEEFNLNHEYWEEIKNNHFTHPWLFISTPSLLADNGNLCCNNCHTLEILTFANYDNFKKLYEKDKNLYDEKIKEIYEKILNIVDKNYLHNIRKYIYSQIVQTPIDMEKNLLVPKGNVYGCRLTPKNLNYNRITSKTPILNLHLVGANASFPGIMGVTIGSMQLYDKIKKTF